ncbi:Uncharacterized protein APZ42_008441 [Daphnia magna]|uniref:Uncharacterized protein n=1 Tax=Daphnia magna TaxID=35525 RepID=A0A164EMR9_9CRUS|nr:Uncharacterized protein APZ42_008441 [Daphnia magna]
MTRATVLLLLHRVQPSEIDNRGDGSFPASTLAIRPTCSPRDGLEGSGPSPLHPSGTIPAL